MHDFASKVSKVSQQQNPVTLGGDAFHMAYILGLEYITSLWYALPRCCDPVPPNFPQVCVTEGTGYEKA